MNNYGSTNDERETTTRTNQMNSHKTNIQSHSRYVLKLQTNNNQQQNRSSLLPQQSSIFTHGYKDKQTRNNKLYLKIVEAIEKEDTSEETLKLTTRWKEITKPGDYRYTQGQWKRYNPPRTLKAEQEKIKIKKTYVLHKVSIMLRSGDCAGQFFDKVNQFSQKIVLVFIDVWAGALSC